MTLQEAIEICRQDETLGFRSKENLMHAFVVRSGMIRCRGKMIFTPDIGMILGDWEIVDLKVGWTS